MDLNAGIGRRRVAAAAVSVLAVGAFGVSAIGFGAAVARPVARSASVAAVAGVIVNSQDRRLPGLAIVVSGQIPSGRVFDFRARTDGDGRFRLGSAAGRLDVVKWTASGAFRWYGGVWIRDLNTLSGRSSDLRFRADVVARGPDSLASGALLRVDDSDGCDSLAASNPAFVATDPGTQSITLRLTPARRLVDGSTGRAGTVTLRSGDLCGLEGEGHQISVPAGAWKVSGVTNHGRPLAFSANLGSGPYERSLTVFDFPMSSSEPVEDIDVHFAS